MSYAPATDLDIILLLNPIISAAIKPAPYLAPTYLVSQYVVRLVRDAKKGPKNTDTYLICNGKPMICKHE